jgi:hypothetical protein
MSIHPLILENYNVVNQYQTLDDQLSQPCHQEAQCISLESFNLS